LRTQCAITRIVAPVERDAGGVKGFARQSAAASFLPTHHMRAREMRIAMFLTSLWLILLGASLLAQSGTYVYSRR